MTAKEALVCEDWDSARFQEFLSGLGFSQYASKAKSQGVNGRDFAQLLCGDGLASTLGIRNLVHRAKILGRLRQLSEAASPARANSERSALRLSRFADASLEPLRLHPALLDGLQRTPAASFADAVSRLRGILPGATAAVAACESLVSERKSRGIIPLTFGEDHACSLALYGRDDGPDSLSSLLNAALRAETRDAVAPYLRLLKLMLSALHLLPRLCSSADPIYRAAIGDVGHHYETGCRFTWWSFSSCMASEAALEESRCLQHEGPVTVFSIVAEQAYDISSWSSSEQGEFLLPPGKSYEVVEVCEAVEARRRVVKLREVESPQSLAEMLEAETRKAEEAGREAAYEWGLREGAAPGQRLDGVPGCGPSCELNHDMDSACLVCGDAFASHTGHECWKPGFEGRRGAFSDAGKAAVPGMSFGMSQPGCGRLCAINHHRENLCLVCSEKWSSHAGHACRSPGFEGRRGSFTSEHVSGDLLEKLAQVFENGPESAAKQECQGDSR